MRIITASYSSTLSLESAEKSRDIVRSDRFKLLYPKLDIKQDKDTKSNFRVVKKTQVYPGRAPRVEAGGGRMSTSVGATITGFHGDILIVDDPLNPEQAVSDQELKTCNRWMDQTLPTRTTDKEATPTILIMQRLHQKDPTGNLLDKQLDDVKHICLPGELNDYGDQLKPPELEKYYKDGLLDSTRLSYRALKGLKAKLGQYGYAGQVGQKPTPPGGGMFKTDNIIIIDALPSPVNFVMVVRYWDKAATEYKKEERMGARTAGVKMAKLQNGKVIILDVKRGAWGTDQREQIIKSTAEADELNKERLNNKRTNIYVEQEPGSGGKDSVQSTIRNLSGYVIYADRPSGDKIYRADPFSVQVNEGNVMMLRGDWNKDYLDELENFPFSLTKDQVDASSGGFAKLTGKRVARML